MQGAAPPKRNLQVKCMLHGFIARNICCTRDVHTVFYALNLCFLDLLSQRQGAAAAEPECVSARNGTRRAALRLERPCCAARRSGAELKRQLEQLGIHGEGNPCNWEGTLDLQRHT